MCEQSKQRSEQGERKRDRKRENERHKCGDVERGGEFSGIIRRE